MTDIHAHILPDADDGSSSLESSLAMLEREVAFGITDVVLTPHYHPRRGYAKTAAELKELFAAIAEEVAERGIPAGLSIGQEISYGEREDVVGMLDRGELLTMNGTNKVLLEFSVSRPPDDISEIAYKFSLHGYKVILAHAEIYPWLDLKTIASMKAEGCFVQINGGSLLRGSAGAAKRRAKALLKDALVDWVASDIHSFRPCDWGKVREKLRKYPADFFGKIG